MVVEADNGAEHFLPARSGFLSEKHYWQTGYLSWDALEQINDH